MQNFSQSKLPEIPSDDRQKVLEMLSRFGLLGGGDVSGNEKQAWAELSYDQPTPVGLLNLGVSGSAYQSPETKQVGIDKLMFGLNRGGSGFGFGVDTDRALKSPYFELTYGKQF